MSAAAAAAIPSTPPKRRAPDLVSRVETARLLWAGGIVIGASLPHCLRLSPWIVLLLTGAITWRLAAAAYGWRVARRTLRLLLAFVAFCAVLTQYGTINGVEAGSALLVVMMAMKFLESQNQRDQLVLIMLSYFLMFASLLTERSPLTIGYLLLMTWVTTVGLLQLGRAGALLPARATAALAGRLLLQALPIMVLLFVVFPRLPGPLWAMPGRASSATSGLSDEMSPGDITNLGLSDRVAFRVAFSGAAPKPSELYWRGPVLGSFDGRTWRILDTYRRGRDVLETIEFSGQPFDYRMMLEGGRRNWAFALDMPQRWSGPRGLTMNGDYQLGVWFGPRVARLDYSATSYTSSAAREPLTEVQQRVLRRLPQDSSPRTRALVASWLEDNPPAAAIIDRGMDYLRSQPFFYTLTPPPLGEQPVDEFLFETREGFCEHYASAFAVMMRAAGLPARVVTGYQGGELNALSRYYIVREADAHAWTEVWIEERGWVRVDPVSAVAPGRVSLSSWRRSIAGAGGAAADFTAGTWLRGAAMIWDATYYYWNTWVVGYGPELQQALLAALGIEGSGRERASILLLLVVGVVLAASFMLTLYLAWRHRGRSPPDPAARCFAAFCRRLRKLNVPPPAPSEGPADYAARAARALPAAATQIAAIAEAYLCARYEPDTERKALAELRARVTAFAAA